MKTKKVFGIFEDVYINSQVQSENIEADELTCHLCHNFGVFTSLKKANKKCKEMNNEDREFLEENDIEYYVREIGLK